MMFSNIMRFFKIVFTLLWRQKWNSTWGFKRNREYGECRWEKTSGKRQKNLNDVCERGAERERQRGADNERGEGSPVRPTRSPQAAGRMERCNRAAVIFFVRPEKPEMLLRSATEWHQPLGEKTHTHTQTKNKKNILWKRHTLPQTHMYRYTSLTTHHFHRNTHRHPSKWLNICIYRSSNYPPVFLFCSFICGWRQVCVRFNESETGSVISLTLPAVSFSLRCYSKKEQKQKTSARPWA